jgi:hypothetical protein
MTQATTTASADQEVTDFITQSLGFVRENDATSMESLFSDEYELVIPTGDVMTKAQLIGIYRSGDMKQVSLDVDNLQVRIYENVAIARGHYRSAFEFNGQPTEQTFLRTDVLVKSGERWKFVTSHTTQTS